MMIFNAILKVAALLIALGYLLVWANSGKVGAGRYTFGRWGSADAPPVVLDTHTGRVYSISGTTNEFGTFDFVSGTITSNAIKRK
jgi:hypothetical protein